VSFNYEFFLAEDIRPVTVNVQLIVLGSTRRM